MAAKGYWIANSEIRDFEGLNRYRDAYGIRAVAGLGYFGGECVFTPMQVEPTWTGAFFGLLGRV